MIEEKSQENIENTTNNQEDNYAETREVSILKRNLRLAKRLILGKNKPPFFLRIVSWAFIIWSLLMTIYFLFNSLFHKFGVTQENADDNIDENTSKFFITYAFLHFIAMIGSILLYRKKLTGFYIFSITTILMPFWEYIILGEFSVFFLSTLIFSLASIILFAVNWRVFDANVKKREKKKQLKREAEMYRNSVNK